LTIVLDVLYYSRMKLSEAFRERLLQDLKDLNGVELKILLWFVLSSKGEWVIIDYKEIMETTGISDKSLRQGIKKLLTMGYLEKKHKGVYRLAPDLVEEVERAPTPQIVRSPQGNFLQRLFRFFFPFR